jgi:osmotically-inducible protein OsmY
MKDNLVKNIINQRLRSHPLVDSSDINVFIYKGDVTLIGTVYTKKQKDLAEYLVKQIPEVNKVIDKLEILSEAITNRLPSLSSIFQRVEQV